MIGRTDELKVLQNALNSTKPELIAVTGRRRVGKTYLVRNFFGDLIDFELVSLRDGSLEQQLRNFNYSLQTSKKLKDPIEKTPADWLEAFHELVLFLESMPRVRRKRVVFIDELPWAATPRSGFLTGLSYFWNSYASREPIVVVICGSASAWMTRRIINDKGGLHNRVTRAIKLNAFTLSETEVYFHSRRIDLDRYQLLHIYMALGGIPHYLDKVEKGKSAMQCLDEICFDPRGPLRNEFDNLYRSLFSNPHRYEEIVRALSARWKGLSRKEVLQITGIKDGGGVTTILHDLEESGFISSYLPFGNKKKDMIYRLTDNYSLFYLRYLRNLPGNESGNLLSLSQTQTWKSWSGYAFESICLQHVDKIKIALGISGVSTRQFSFHVKATDHHEGAQIDLLIDRMDQSISLCKMKFYNDQVSLTKEEAHKIRHRQNIFREVSRTKKQLFNVLISPYGMVGNKNSLGLIDNQVTMDDLF